MDVDLKKNLRSEDYVDDARSFRKLTASTTTTKESISSKNLDDQESPLITTNDMYQPPVLHVDRYAETSPFHETQQQKQQKIKFLRRAPTTFLEDALKFGDGCVFHSVVAASVIAVICGVVASIYYKILVHGINFFWTTLPEKVVIGKWPEWTYPLWIPIMGFSMAFIVAYTVKYVGDPGGLPVIVKFNHQDGYLNMVYTPPMIIASLASMFSGGSLGPEAPLALVCASLGGFISRKLFKQTDRNMIRKHSLMGMAGVLSAFFGSPLGGSLFALEIHSRFGTEYFEHAVEAVFCGALTTAVFCACTGRTLDQQFFFNSQAIISSGPSDVVLGFLLGLVGAGLAAVFVKFHNMVMALFQKLGLLKDERILQRALLGTLLFVIVGEFIPHTLFWGQAELQVISTMGPSKDLPHVFPTTGLIDFEMDSAFTCFLLTICKIMTVTFSLAGGLRGGFIFPFIDIGVAFGRCLMFFFPSLPASYACMCVAAGLNVGITRTALGTTLILTTLYGEPYLTSAVLTASLTSLFATIYMDFFKTQVVRNDLDKSFYYEEKIDESDDDTIEETSHSNLPSSMSEDTFGIL